MSEEISKQYLKEKQYSTTKYLEARIKIHQFTRNTFSFHEWIFNQYNLNSFIGKEIKILDIGCGTGVFWKKNAEKFNKYKLDIVFTDFSEAMVEKEKLNTSELIAKKRYEVADVENLEKFKGQFDLVLCHNVLYHADDKNKALKNLKECLNKNVNSFCSITTNS